MISALDKLRDAVKNRSDEITDAKTESGSSHFWQCLFLATITNASRRQGALAYLVRRLPKFGTTRRRGSLVTEKVDVPEALPTEAEAAISPEPGLLIRCYEAGLLDTQLLIQRGFLDLLVSHLPLDTPVLQQRISKEDLGRLVAAASSVVSRRDMSLNRRLWAWFLGPEPSATTDDGDSVASPATERGSGTDPSTYHAAYFSQYGLQALTHSVMKMIKRPSTLPADRARPFRICLSLMDRWEVGGLIVPEVFLPALQSVQSYSEIATKEQVEEVLRSASIFFDGVESGLIWGKLMYLVSSSLDTKQLDRQEALRKMKLAKFILSRFNLKEEEMLVNHMPLVIVSTLIALNMTFDGGESESLVDREVIDLAFEIVDSLVQIIPDRALRTVHNGEPVVEDMSLVSREAVYQKVHAFYEEHQGNLDYSEPPLAAAELGQYVLRESISLFVASLPPRACAGSSDMPSRILSSLLFKIQQFKMLEEHDIMSTFQTILPLETVASQPLPFCQLVAITSVLSALQTAHTSHPWVTSSQLAEVMHPLIACLWFYLSPLSPKYHVEAVHCMLQLHALSFTERMVEAAISTIIVGARSGTRAPTVSAQSECARRFAVLWTHTMHELTLQSENRGNMSRRSSGVMTPLNPTSSVGGFQSVLTRPLLLLLDSLADEGTELSVFTRNWLQNLPTLNKVFEVLVYHLDSLHCLRSNDTLSATPTSLALRLRLRGNDIRECLYYLTHILHIVEHPSHNVWATLVDTDVAQKETVPPSKMALQVWLVRTCLKALSITNNATDPENVQLQELYRVAIAIIVQVCQGPFASSLRDLEVEVPLMARLKTATPSLQSLLLEAILSALRLRLLRPEQGSKADHTVGQQAMQRSRLSFVIDRSSVEVEPEPISPPPQLVDCLKYGFSSSTSRLVLDDWVQFLIEVLPMFADTIFQNLLPLVECICKQITRTFDELKVIFSQTSPAPEGSPESTLISLINGLEQILAKAHDRLMIQETKSTANKSPEQPQGFFGNMVSGVFTSEANQQRIPTANTRLTVLLCFQDTVRICFAIWSWGGYGAKDSRQDPTSSSSFTYTSQRMRNRARRLLEHLFAAEALECLETLAVLWVQYAKDAVQATAVMGVLNVLNGSKPKHTIPAIFNAVYSRTNPSALDPHRMSSLTSDLTDLDLVTFLVDYTKSLEDDAMDEIWSDCNLFLRDVLANPLPHRQILPTLLEFAAVIGQKVDNTNFGEQRKMRKELADIFTRVLTATFTTRSMGFLQDPSQVIATEKVSTAVPTNGTHGHRRTTDVVSILTLIVPYLPIILIDNDRVTNVVTTISTNVIGPTFRAKAFPDNVSKSTLDLLYQLSRVAQANRSWKKDIFDAFNDTRFFNTPLPLLKSSWLPVLSQWTHSDKDRLPELLSRLSAPTTAGIMFGVGASSARQEADRKTQLTLRRLTLLLLAAPEDTFTPNLQQLMEKISELFGATPASSPSSITRSEVIILLRAIILKTSSIHLAPLWPVINGELNSGLSSLLPDAENKDGYNNAGLIQLCKLLDQLVVLDPDDFQLIEWLFITDTIDAVYKPESAYPTSLTDEIAEILSASETPTSRPRSVPVVPHHQSSSSADEPKRTLFLDPLIDALQKEEGAEVTDMARRELVDRVVRPFLGQLAIVNFEATYGGGVADWQGVWDSVVADARGVD
ncbi:hypothetical protein K491DRAFT_682733 [Lophiostoma macrostomum CBS 122681]|uniref:Uncharacterized protein n=1 Tax=Lophiostoma macrostomum CBS 122681 TaxID=1314788 RepID=A0A6A6ST76_9PLEO|nr:hypothetical protein K491DRAFT_682733 [Lophiostoma macrostomum CBS 122681]